MADEALVVDATAVRSIDEKQLVPPGGVLLIFQHGGEPPVFPENSKPSFTEIDDAAWDNFEKELKTAAAKMWSNRLLIPFFCLIPVLLAIVILEMLFGIFPEKEQARRLQSSSSSSSSSSDSRRRSSVTVSEGKKERSDLFGAVVFGLGAIMGVGVLGGYCFVTGKNVKWDKAAKAACEALAEATGLVVEYRTIRNAQAWRAVAIAPKDGVAKEEECPFGMQTVRVKLQRAEQAKAGKCFEVEAPDGAKKQVRVPKRLNADYSFEVSMPRLKPREAVSVAVTVPEGNGPGSVMEVTAPDGRKVQAVVPPDHVPGQTFMVAVPADSPQAELLGQPAEI